VLVKQPFADRNYFEFRAFDDDVLMVCFKRLEQLPVEQVKSRHLNLKQRLSTRPIFGSICLEKRHHQMSSWHVSRLFFKE
jgi:hypothetical protein